MPHFEIHATDVGRARKFYGGLFGFFCYATYDLTNLATLKGWPVKMVAIDIVWGTVLTGSCAAIGVWLTQMIVAK